MIDLNYTWFDIECPRCKYADEIQLVDAKIEVLYFCNNCKVKIQIQDNEGSVHNGIDTMNNIFKDLDKLFKNFGK